MEQLRVMIIGAHPDDCDFECGGIALKYAKLGHKVKFLSLCNGDCGHQEMTCEQTAARRRQESLTVQEKFGIEYDVWMDSHDCQLVATLENRARLICDIRNFNPDIIFTCRPNDYHADHRNASLLVQDASYLLIVPHYCPEAPAMKKMPTIMYNFDYFQNPPFETSIAVRTDDVIDDMFKMFACHESQVFEWLPWTHGLLHTVPQNKDERLSWLHEPRIDRKATLDDLEYLKTKRIPLQSEERQAKLAVWNKDALIKRYGEEEGKKVLFAEAFSVCEYGAPFRDELIPF